MKVLAPGDICFEQACAAAKAESPDAALEWVSYLAGQQSQQRFVVNSGLWPARATAIEGTKLATDPAYAAFATMLKDGRQYPPVAAWVEIETVLAKDLATLWTATTPQSSDQVAKVLDQTANDMRNVMNK